jgi:hypothetical protein
MKSTLRFLNAKVYSYNSDVAGMKLPLLNDRQAFSRITFVPIPHFPVSRSIANLYD